ERGLDQAQRQVVLRTSVIFLLIRKLLIRGFGVPAYNVLPKLAGECQEMFAPDTKLTLIASYYRLSGIAKLSKGDTEKVISSVAESLTTSDLAIGENHCGDVARLLAEAKDIEYGAKKHALTVD
ncbi:MAG: hypothetical protein Q9157_005623, partial [Trypethelium eluteriae]